MMKKALLLIISFIASVACASTKSENNSQEMIHKRIKVGNIEREYYIHRPKVSSNKLPVLFVLHGGKGTALARAKQTGMNFFADRDGFITIYPQGVDNRWNSNLNSGVDDVAFFQAMIDEVVRFGGVDSSRIYVMGGSNGGMMAYRLACELSERLAAVVAIVASMPKDIVSSCRPSAKLPILIMAGTADPLMPYQGGLVAKGKGGGDIGSVVSIDETLNLWKNINLCQGQPSKALVADRDPKDGIITEIETWLNCAPGIKMQFYKMIGAGHGLPGRSADKSSFSRMVGGKSTNDFDSSEVSWNFLRQFSKN